MNQRTMILGAAWTLAAVLSWVLAGTLGLFVVVSLGFVVLLVLAGLRLPRTPRRRSRRPRDVAFPNAAFPAYRRIEDTLFWAPVSARHFDYAVRPLLARLLAVALAERHGIDMAADPASARAAIGADLWPLVDPARTPSEDTRTPGVPLPVVLRFIDRLEEL